MNTLDTSNRLIKVISNLDDLVKRVEELEKKQNASQSTIRDSTCGARD